MTALFCPAAIRVETADGPTEAHCVLPPHDSAYMHESSGLRWDHQGRLYCTSLYMGVVYCAQQADHGGDHSNAQAQWGHDVCGAKLLHGIPCQREPGHEGDHEGARRTAVRVDRELRTPPMCRRVGCERKYGHGGQHADGRTAVALDNGDVWTHPEAAAPALTEERVDDALMVLERRVMARLSQLAARVAALESTPSTLAQINAKTTELVDRPDLSETLERLAQAVDLMSDKLLPTDAITAHVSSNISTVLDAIQVLKDPQPVVYPYERSGVTVLGPDTYLHAGNWVIVHKGKSFYVEGNVRPESRVCGATFRTLDNSIFFCQRSPSHSGLHRDAKQEGLEKVSWGPEPDVISCGDSDGEPWCKQAEHHEGDCDPVPASHDFFGD